MANVFEVSKLTAPFATQQLHRSVRGRYRAVLITDAVYSNLFYAIFQGSAEARLISEGSICLEEGLDGFFSWNTSWPETNIMSIRPPFSDIFSGCPGNAVVPPVRRTGYVVVRRVEIWELSR
jgi:hypothetical protein